MSDCYFYSGAKIPSRFIDKIDSAFEQYNLDPVRTAIFRLSPDINPNYQIDAIQDMLCGNQFKPPEGKYVYLIIHNRFAPDVEQEWIAVVDIRGFH